MFSAKAMNSPAAFEIDGLKYFRWKRCAIQLIYPIWLKNKRCSKSALNVDSKESIGTGCKIVVSGLRAHDDDIVDRNGEEHISFVRYEYAWVKFARCESQDRESCHKVRGTRFVMLAWGDITIWRGQSQMCAIVECCLRWIKKLPLQWSKAFVAWGGLRPGWRKLRAKSIMRTFWIRRTNQIRIIEDNALQQDVHCIWQYIL